MMFENSVRDLCQTVGFNDNETQEYQEAGRTLDVEVEALRDRLNKGLPLSQDCVGHILYAIVKSTSLNLALLKALGERNRHRRTEE